MLRASPMEITLLHVKNPFPVTVMHLHGELEGPDAAHLLELATQEYQVYLATIRSRNEPQIFRIGYCQDYPDANSWDRDAFLMPGMNLDFDTIEYRNFSLVVLNLRAPSLLLGFQLGGIVGHKFLAPYRVSMDLVNSELRLEKS